MSTQDAAGRFAGSAGATGKAAPAASGERLAGILGLLLLALLVFALFVVAAPAPDEDAYIGYVYAQSLLAGEGLTYHGVRVEGYTNPLTVVLTALVSWSTGLPVASAGALLSALFTILTVALFFLLQVRALRARSGAWAAAAVATAASAALVLDPYFLYWGLSGMENSLLSAIVLAAILALAAGRPRLSLLCAALLPLVRFDGLVPALLIAGFHAWLRLAADRSTPLALRFRQQLPAMAAMVGLTLAPFLAGMAFRILYYGERVPNTAWPKFLLRLPADRFAEGVAYLWNTLWASKSLLYLVAIAAVAALGRVRWNAVMRLTGLLLFGATAHLIAIGGDVAWKPYFRFGHLLVCLVLLLLFLSLSHLRLVWQSLLVALVLVSTTLLQPGPWAPRLAYSRDFETRYEWRFTPPTRGLSWRGLRSAPQRWYRGITRDFAEDPFAATGKYLHSVADASDLLVTSAAGKVVYYSGLRAIDTTGLADRVWSREATPEERLSLLDDVRFLVFHRDDSACYFGAFVAPRSAFVPIAVVTEHRGWVWVFSNRDPGPQPDAIGERTIYTRHAVEIEGRPVSLYSDSFDAAVDPESARREYERWSRCSPSGIPPSAASG